MLGHAVYGRGRAGRVTENGLVLYRVYLKKEGLFAPFWRKKQWKIMRRRGVRFAIFPPELGAEAAACGIRPFSVAPLRRALLGQLVGRGRCACLRADGVDGDVERAALLLAKRYRYVMLDVGRGEEDLTALLYRRFGVGRCAAGQPEMTVTFRDERPVGPAVCLGERCGEYQSACYEIEGWTGENIPEAYLCALFLAGKRKKEELCVKSLVSNA